MKYENMDIKSTWLRHYASIVLPCICVFFVPKIFLENFSIDHVYFNFKESNITALTSRWTFFLLSFCIFNIVGFYIAFNTFVLRSKYIERKRRNFVYLFDLIVVLSYSGIYLIDRWFGRSIFSGSDMLGVGTMQKALQGKDTFFGWDLIYTLNFMVHVINITSVFYAMITISNYVIITSIPPIKRRGKRELSVLNFRRDLYYRNLYSSGVLLTVGVFQLAAWLSLPTDFVVESENFTSMAQSIILYLSVLFSAVAICAAFISASYFNRYVFAYLTNEEVNQRFRIYFFDKSMILSVFLPATVGYLIKVVPSLFS